MAARGGGARRAFFANRGKATLSKSNPTDHALAAIASILDYPEFRREAEGTNFDEPVVTVTPHEAGGYFKIGPGPIAAIRFKWSVRLADDGAYYVDETIGVNSLPAVAGPMTREAAVRMVDDREGEARRRFEELKSEMAGRSAAALVLHNSSGQF
jgi:hypothetical protein